MVGRNSRDDCDPMTSDVDLSDVSTIHSSGTAYMRKRKQGRIEHSKHFTFGWKSCSDNFATNPTDTTRRSKRKPGLGITARRHPEIH